MKMMLNEDQLDLNRLYFHGSRTPRKREMRTPSARYPFYFTPDLHYAMAYATKPYSSTGGGRNIKYLSEFGYVYVVTIDPSANMFDFRKEISNSFKTMSKIFPRQILNLIDNDVPQHSTDIYMFTQHLMDYFWPIKSNEKITNVNIPDFNQNLNALIDFFDENNLDEYIDDDGEAHSLMQFIFDKLNSLGYDGIITTEWDRNSELNSEVSTNYAVGIWNKKGFNISQYPLKYSFCKKINPEFVNNQTSSNAISKANRYIDIYRKMFNNEKNNK